MPLIHPLIFNSSNHPPSELRSHLKNIIFQIQLQTLFDIKISSMNEQLSPSTCTQNPDFLVMYFSSPQEVWSFDFVPYSSSKPLPNLYALWSIHYSCPLSTICIVGDEHTRICKWNPPNIIRNLLKFNSLLQVFIIPSSPNQITLSSTLCNEGQTTPSNWNNETEPPATPPLLNYEITLQLYTITHVVVVWLPLFLSSWKTTWPPPYNTPPTSLSLSSLTKSRLKRNLLQSH